MHAILKHWHPMMGTDFHIPWPPGSPAPAPSPVPYRTAMILMGTGATCAMATRHPSMGWGFTMQQGTDIGPLIPHIGPPSVLLPLEILLSSSKSYFGVAQYPVEGRPVAVAMAGMTNFNLNCGTPMPTPTGMVLAMNTHFVSMSMADVIYSTTYMALDWGLQTALQWAGGKVGGLVASQAALPIQYLTYRFGPQVLSKTAAKQLLRQSGRRIKGRDINRLAREMANARSDRVASNLRYADNVTSIAADNLTSWFLGGPMGADNAAVGGPTVADATGLGSIPQSGAQAAADYVDNPSIPEHPSTAPSQPAATEPPPSGPETPGPDPTPTSETPEGPNASMPVEESPDACYPDDQP